MSEIETNQVGYYQEGKLSLREVLLLTLLKFPAKYLEKDGCFEFKVRYEPYPGHGTSPFTAWKITRKDDV